MRKKTERIPFSEARIRDLPTPVEGRQSWQDTKTPGLFAVRTATGRTSFFFYKWADGRPVRMLIGKHPSITVQQAQRAARKMAGDMATGADPHAERRARREEPTLDVLWKHWEIHAASHKKPKSAAEDKRQYERFLKGWGPRRLSSIKKPQVQALHAQLGRENGIYAANRLLSLLAAMFHKAEEIGYRGENPARGVKPFRETARDRFLHPEELRQFFEALAAETPLFRDFFTVALLTGARRGNVQAMAWSDVDLQSRFWRIPDTKGGFVVVVPLVGPVVELLEVRKAIAGEGIKYVFPGRKHGEHLKEPKTAWKRILKRAGLSDLRPHDLRRSLGSWMASTNASLPIIGKMLGHTRAATTMIYSRLVLDPIREAAEKAADMILQHGGKLLPAPLATGSIDPVSDVEQPPPARREAFVPPPCSACGAKMIVTSTQGRKRYLKCPACGETAKRSKE